MKYITVKLTEDQFREVIGLVVNHVSESEAMARKHEMALDPKWVAFMKRLQTTLAQAKIS